MASSRFSRVDLMPPSSRRWLWAWMVSAVAAARAFDLAEVSLRSVAGLAYLAIFGSVLATYRFGIPGMAKR